MKGENNLFWNPDRDSVRLNRIIAKRCSSILTRCLDKLGRYKNDKTQSLLGYTRKQLKQHIISHPNWKKVENKDWHIDHKFPVKAFIEHGIDDLKIINALENLQPMSSKDNLVKGSNYDKNEFQNWLIQKIGRV